MLKTVTMWIVFIVAVTTIYSYAFENKNDGNNKTATNNSQFCQQYAAFARLIATMRDNGYPIEYTYRSILQAANTDKASQSQKVYMMKLLGNTARWIYANRRMSVRAIGDQFYAVCSRPNSFMN